MNVFEVQMGDGSIDLFQKPSWTFVSQITDVMFIRGGFCRKGRYGVTFGTLRHGEDASSAKSSGGARDLAYRMKRLMVDDKLQDVTFSVGEVGRHFLFSGRCSWSSPACQS